MTLAGRGWTFEAICCGGSRSDDGNDNVRVVTKKAIRRLETEGILESSRPRGPGFGPRLLRIATAFPARDELQAVIDAIPVAWPDLGDRAERTVADLSEKTKTYFRRRGLCLRTELKRSTRAQRSKGREPLRPPARLNWNVSGLN